MKTGKIWGKTQEIFKNFNFEVHNISIRKGGYCSKHKHVFKYNMFFVISGRLKIKVWKNDYKVCDETILEKGEKTVVGPGEYHQFEALDRTKALEIYYPESIQKDIIRESKGGILLS
jgi:quercetin dioxygenase-like cupin family protein